MTTAKVSGSHQQKEKAMVMLRFSPAWQMPCKQACARKLMHLIVSYMLVCRDDCTYLFIYVMVGKYAGKGKLTIDIYSKYIVGPCSYSVELLAD